MYSRYRSITKTFIPATKAHTTSRHSLLTPLPVEFRITGRVPDSTVSPMLLGWSATRMGGMLTRVAHWLAVMNGTPSVAIGLLAKVPPLCVTVIGACASRKVKVFAILW